MFQWGFYFFFHKCKVSWNNDRFLYIFQLPHAHFITMKLRKMFYTLYNIRKFLGNSDRKLFFNTIILPHIIYASHFLLHTNKAAISALTKTFNRSLKILFKILIRSSSANIPSLTGNPSLTSSIKNSACFTSSKIFINIVPNNPFSLQKFFQ